MALVEDKTMQNQNAVMKLASRIAICGLVIMLAGCSKDEPEACEQARNGFFPLLNALACLTGSEDNVTTKSDDSGTTGYSPVDGQDIGYQIGEYEPNSSLNNANPVILSSAGLAIAGTITRASDATDHFVFTPPQSGTYGVYLCDGSCDRVLESAELNVMVYDQSQTTISGTPLGSEGAQAVTVDMDAGIAYYVAVSGYNAGPDVSSYQLAIVLSTAVRSAN